LKTLKRDRRHHRRRHHAGRHLVAHHDAEGQACVLGKCVAFDGDCVSNNDCHGDTFCCSKNCLPMGEQPGVCIDFGNEPEGDACLARARPGVGGSAGK